MFCGNDDYIQLTFLLRDTLNSKPVNKVLMDATVRNIRVYGVKVTIGRAIALENWRRI